MSSKPVEELVGRELDAAVAGEVFGALVGWPYRGERPVYDGDDPLTCVVSGVALPHYSTDISAAWEVVGRFVGAGLAAWVEGDGHTGYRAGCTNQLGRFEADAPTAPEAICRAALKAVRAQKEADDTPPEKPTTTGTRRDGV